MRKTLMTAALAASALVLVSVSAEAGRGGRVRGPQDLAAKEVHAPVAVSNEVTGSFESDGDAALREIERMFGFVPSFLKVYPKHGLAGAWAMTRDLEVSDKTALSPKVKALINIAVAAQIPCRYCVWLDTQSAKSFGATDQELAEAVAQSALTRHWSTVLNGMQIDFEEFKTEFGGD